MARIVSCVNFISYLIILLTVLFTINCETSDTKHLKEKKASLIKNIKKLKKEEGALKLVGGRGDYEGNVEILHDGKWGAVCDDEWDKAEASVVCRQLGYTAGSARYTHSGAFGPAKRRYWLDNIICTGDEKELSHCRSDGWGHNDCGPDEAAGVQCSPLEDQQPEELTTSPPIINKISMPPKIMMRLAGGRMPKEGRVEIKLGKEDSWQVICGDGWSLLEAMVVCRSLNLGYASDAIPTDYFGGNANGSKITGLQCRGNENSLSECLYNEIPYCPGNGGNVATVYCVDKMADLIIDHYTLMETAHLEDKQMYFLQCAMEENCLASQAYKIQQEQDAWHLDTRRLLKFTASVFNGGTADFRPAIPKHLWEWHMCHMHYHSMEVFATFDIYDKTGKRVAEGHKASFCLEDNQCMPGIKQKYACDNYGDQGISVNCTDIYKYTVDCQWVDISELDPGHYTFKVVVNPELKVPEISFDNNAAVCEFVYTETNGRLYNCNVTRP